jgi:ABC-type phosphate transport system substrate-binding protein
VKGKKMKKLTKILLTSLILFLISSSVYSQSGNSYKIIVNKSNPVESISKKNVSKIFLKKTTIWDNGEKIFPVDLNTKSSLREKFSKDIHGKSVSAINAYWRKQIFSGNSVPPVEKSSNRDVLAYVKGKSGAIGYVSVNTVVTGVKVLEITN